MIGFLSQLLFCCVIYVYGKARFDPTFGVDLLKRVIYLINWWLSDSFYVCTNAHIQPRPNFANEGMRDYIIDAVMSWIEHFHFDAVRVDSTSNIRNDHTGELAEGWELMQELCRKVHTRFPGTLMVHTYEADNVSSWLSTTAVLNIGCTLQIAEDLFNDPFLNLGGAGFDCQWDQSFFHKLYHSVTCHSDSRRNIPHLVK